MRDLHLIEIAQAACFILIGVIGTCAANAAADARKRGETRNVLPILVGAGVLNFGLMVAA